MLFSTYYAQNYAGIIGQGLPAVPIIASYITRVGGAGCTILPSLPSLSIQGYCGFMFTVHDRLLVLANPNIGVLHHSGKYYAFSSKEAADGFAGNPEGESLKFTANKSDN